MREQIEMEEVFENEELFAAELEAERAEAKRKFAAEMFWFIHKRRQQGDWDWSKKWHLRVDIYKKIRYTFWSYEG